MYSIYMATHPSILLIEDSPGECELFRLALVQTGLDVALYTEQDAEAAFHFLRDRAHHSQWSVQACSSSLQEGGLNRSPTARIEGAHSDRAASASTGDRSDLPSLILLDLHLRGQNGCDFLKRLRADPRFAAIPVVVFTTSDDQHDLSRCYASGANGYVVKPGTFAELVHCTADLCRYWLTWNRSLSMVETKC
jgi:two-component system, chemotaxis family, response regulator Rcp1